MATTKFEERLKKIQSGRGYSPAYIRKTVDELFSLDLDKVIDPGDGDRFFLDQTVADFKRLAGMRSGEHTYGEAVERIYEKTIDTMYIPADTILTLTFSHISKHMKAFLDLPVDEYMKAAGAEEGYDRWFMLDAMTWERDNGVVPTIGDVLKTSYKSVVEDREDEYRLSRRFVEIVVPTRDDIPKGIEKAFGRKYGEYGMEMIGNIACCWVWILMVEVPLMMKMNVDGKQAFPRVTIQV